MAKAKPVQFGTLTGYNDWSVMRTIREAENIARWNPWKAHEWMEEARQRLDLFNAPYHDQFDDAVHRINALWRSNMQCHWYDSKTFWMDGKQSRQPKFLDPLYEDFSL